MLMLVGVSGVVGDKMIRFCASNVARSCSTPSRSSSLVVLVVELMWGGDFCSLVTAVKEDDRHTKLLKATNKEQECILIQMLCVCGQ